MIKIKTTKADHEAAIRCPHVVIVPSTGCLLAQAVKRVTGRNCVVTANTVFFPDKAERYALPKSAREAVVAFDSKRAFTEVEFVLKDVVTRDV